jgi:hypothetical protein
MIVEFVDLVEQQGRRAEHAVFVHRAVEQRRRVALGCR